MWLNHYHILAQQGVEGEDKQQFSGLMVFKL